MSFTAEGTIEIDMEDFTCWIYENYLFTQGVEFQLGIPRVNKSNQTLEVDFAMGTDTNPKNWSKIPKAIQQWEN